IELKVLSRAKVALVVLFALCLIPNAFGQLARTGPVDSNNGFPQWYQDQSGLVLDACLPSAAELADGTCLVTPDQLANPSAPIVFPSNFPDEFFFFNANSKMTVNGGNALLLMALEGAFLNGPVLPGDQMVFARLRIRIDVPAPGGNYRIIFPFGVKDFPNVPPGTKTINFTSDIGLTAGQFDTARNGIVSTFLRASTTAGGTPSPFVVLDGDTFIADSTVTTPVTGSPFGTNVFRIEGPNIGGPGIDFIETDQFTLEGRVHLAPVPSPVVVNRATYRRDANSAQADIFATATPAIGRPTPVLSVTGAGIWGVVLNHNGTSYFGEPQLSNPASIPASIMVTNSSDSPTSYTEADLVDDVIISAANYDPATQTLLVRAMSGDQLSPPSLTVAGFGPLDSTGQFAATVAVPPSEVTVISSHGGRDTQKVTIGSFVRNVNAPHAENDFVGEVPADIATSISILDNDTPNMGVTPRILANPAHGIVSIDPLTGSASYTPTHAYSGPDSFSYINTNASGLDSNVALVSFNVAFVNHPPIANDDAASASVTTPVTIDVLGNDTDPDAGDTLNPLTVTIVSAPASGDAIPNTNGTITFSPAPGSSGNVTFQYTVQDSHLAVSNAATVTVNVVAPDTLNITQAQFRTRGDWRIRGTSTIPGPGNTITIHNGPTLGGPVIGTIAVDNTGAWDFSLKSSNVVPDATHTISIESTKGGQRLSFPVTITN
ncbi:MAG TPA: Ig-like domain-containing protein, partial [Candidatus Angelobacter sp.]|nr:Ig-like domain-containing protein [Candidatus Angelobacter sp.]